ncbi:MULTISPECIES: hypothetical protein [Serratia]|uniref:hypothetical protein n=1 Tax=Serratia TaxID=613 RepID=UPI000B615609|nr:hypothetical protein [Serratia marcescens]ASM06713.1 hypothetical protein BVG91_06555 [Serratia marcescens]MDX7543775.1 hypothetical protein [Serratia marcescens]MDX7565394.1 hypothetical protein [Serratia marcescens]
MEFSEQVAIAAIKAAGDITVAKINAKGQRFDGYAKPMNWFKQSLGEVIEAMEKEMRMKP